MLTNCSGCLRLGQLEVLISFFDQSIKIHWSDCVVIIRQEFIMHSSYPLSFESIRLELEILTDRFALERVHIVPVGCSCAGRQFVDTQ